jgi:TIR domain-containing protein
MPIDNGGQTATDCESGQGVQSIKDMRVFISYAHEDYATALKIRNYLRCLGAHVLWDRSFALGSGFHEQIKTQIAYAHVFMPIITPSSSARGWVHQEIGYAMAMNVPVLPVALKELPDAMIGPLHAVMLRDQDDINRLGEHLKADALSLLVDQHDDPTLALHVCADESEDRAAMLYRYASEVRRLIGERHAVVLQSSALSSFHIPAETLRHQVFTDRYNLDDQKGLHYRRLQRRERLALQWHACRSGARLIICPEVMTETGLRPLAALTRFQTLVDFLEKAPDTIELRHGALKPHGENVTIVGDWFMATSLIGTRATGYRQTIFTRHAPTIGEQIKLFNREFDDTKEFPGQGSSRQNAIAYLCKEIECLRPLAGSPRT